MAKAHVHGADAALSGGYGASGSQFGQFSRVFGRVHDYFVLRRAERELMALDDRMLSDIGIDRADIRERVWNGRR